MMATAMADALVAAQDCLWRGYKCAKSNQYWTREKAKEYAEELFPTLSNAVFLSEEICILLFMKGFEIGQHP